VTINATNAKCKASVPELVETANLAPQYLANSSSNLKILFPITNLSLRKASNAAALISSSKNKFTVLMQKT